MLLLPKLQRNNKRNKNVQNCPKNTASEIACVQIFIHTWSGKKYMFFWRFEAIYRHFEFEFEFWKKNALFFLFIKLNWPIKKKRNSENLIAVYIAHCCWLMGILVLWGIDLAIRSSTLCCSSTERYGECQSFPFAAQHTIERETTAIKQSTAVACNCIIQRHSANNNNNSNKNRKELKKNYEKELNQNAFFRVQVRSLRATHCRFFFIFFFSSFHCLSFGVPSIASETREMMCSFICIKKMANTKSICNNMSLRRLFFCCFCLFVCCCSYSCFAYIAFCTKLHVNWLVGLRSPLLSVSTCPRPNNVHPHVSHISPARCVREHDGLGIFHIPLSIGNREFMCFYLGYMGCVQNRVENDCRRKKEEYRLCIIVSWFIWDRYWLCFLIILKNLWHKFSNPFL